MEYLIACGSNLGDRHENIARALVLLAEHGVTITRKSTLMESEPIGAADQTFLNGAFVCTTSLEPEEMMQLLLAVETKLGRTRDVKWGNRTIDLDIVSMRDQHGADMSWHSKDLIVPHPRMWERDFVMIPSKEIWTFSPTRISSSVESFWDIARFLAAATLLRGLFASLIPFGNDEAYYWDWGRDVQLSYFDHPPMVSWVSWLGQQLVGLHNPELAGRFFIPLMHLTASIFMYDILRKVFNANRVPHTVQICFLLVTQLVPAFSLGGIMLMPDAGLILFSTWGVWLLMSYVARPKLTASNAFILGVIWGAAGLSKYHAAVIAMGAFGYVLWQRRVKVRQELTFWFLLIAVGLLTVSPVLLWNFQHDWVSFAFQISRGVSNDGFRIVPALRTLLAELLFVGPAFLFGLWNYFQSQKSMSLEAKLLLAAAGPLLGLVKLFSFTSQTLPHWSMPSLWLLSPFAIIGLSSAARWMKGAFWYGLVFCILIPALLASSVGRNRLLTLLNDHPGGLGELTLWNVASNDSEFIEYLKNPSWFTDKSYPNCHRPLPVYAATRWFTVAQSASQLPWHPVVESVDPNKLSYYNYRTPAETWRNCPLVILAEEAHYKGLLNSDTWNVSEQKRFIIRGHQDRPVVVLRVIGPK